MLDTTAWTKLVADFRSLGGVIEGVIPDERNGMRGLFVDGPGKKHVVVRVPRHLLIPVSDICIKGETLSVREGSKVRPDVKAFFENYHSKTSWQGGRDGTRQFLQQMQELPAPARRVLKDDIGTDTWFNPVTDNLVLEHFLRARAIVIDSKLVVAPMLEIANHANVTSNTKLTKDYIAIDGEYDGEVLWQYAKLDSFQMFAVFNFPTVTRHAYSVPFTISNQAAGLQIKVDNKPAAAAAPINGVPMPLVRQTGSLIEMGFLLLGDRDNVHAPVLSFRNAIAAKLGNSAFEFFEHLQFLNRSVFLKLLASLEDADSDVARDLRKVCRLQLEALSACSLR